MAIHNGQGKCGKNRAHLDETNMRVGIAKSPSLNSIIGVKKPSPVPQNIGTTRGKDCKPGGGAKV